jgi:hypothetical protein
MVVNKPIDAPAGGTEIELTLHRLKPGAAWTAELHARPGEPAQRFASLKDLIDWLAGLSDEPPARGLR